MPDFPIIDTHVHFWDTAYLRYPWLDTIPLLNKPYLPEDYHRSHSPVQVEKLVFVQAEAEFAQFREEIAWVTTLAQQDPTIQGIVSWAPLEDGDAARPELERLAQNPLVKGIRRIIQFEPDLEFCLRPGFVRGVQALPDYGLSFDICISHIHLANTIKLVQQCPQVRFILDHIAKPDIAHQRKEPWKQEIKQLASFPNVWCKLSGLVTEADHQRWTEKDLQPYLAHVLEVFGLDRVMFGGDWPVLLQASPYPRWVAALDATLQGCSPEEWQKVYRENARAFYRLG